jgi:hypothetical protein
MSGLLIFASGGDPIPRAPTRTSLWQLPNKRSGFRHRFTRVQALY